MTPPDANEKRKTFLSLTFEGGRFVEHTMPVDTVVELATMQSLIHDVARHLFLSANPGRTRVSVGFLDATKLHITASVENCYSVSLSRAEELAPEPDIHEDSLFIEQARDLTLEALRCAGAGESIPTTFPTSAYDQLSNFGRRLRSDEWLNVSNATASKSARVDQHSRAALSKVVRRPLLVNAELDGEIDQVDDASNRFWLRLESGQKVEVPLNRHYRAEVIETLMVRPLARMRIEGQMQVGAGGSARLLSADEIEIYDSARAGDVMKIWERLRTFADIEEGWLDGVGHTPTLESRIRAQDVLSRLLVSSNDIAAPAVFPTPDGGVQAEWILGSWAADVKFFPSGETIEAEAVNADTGQESDRTFGVHDLTAEDATALAQWLRELR